MEGSDGSALSTEFQKRLEHDGFGRVGYYEIDESDYRIFLNREAWDRAFTIYCFVSFADGRKYIRIGKVEKEGLKNRLKPYWVNKALHLSVDIAWVREHMHGWTYNPSDATAEMLSKLGRFTTPPWERENWMTYTVPYGGRGLIFSRASGAGSDTRSTLLLQEKDSSHCTILHVTSNRGPASSVRGNG